MRTKADLGHAVEAAEARALRMREAGDTWREVALALAESTGVRLGDRELAGHMQYHYDEA